MNINEELNRIIFKYNIDRCYPHYRNMCRAEKVLQRLINEITEDKRKAIFVGNDPKGIEFIQNMAGDYVGIQFVSYDREDLELHFMENIAWNEYCGEVYLISLYGAEYTERWFWRHNVPFQWLYNIFEKEGIYFQKEFFVFGQADIVALFDKDRVTHTRSCYTGASQCELYVQKNRYKYAKDQEAGYIALEKCLFLALYMKNFAEAKKYACLLAEKDEKYEELWKEIERLFGSIKNRLKVQNRKDIILYWLDAVSYKDENDMPYLKAMKDKSVVFENAFTNIAYTSSTARAVFLGKRDIDDGVYDVSEFTEENSLVLRFLKKQGYGIKIISGGLSRYFPHSCRSKQFYMDAFEAASVKLWDMLSNMLLEEKKTFYLVHALEAHSPFLNSEMEDGSNVSQEERCRTAERELDKQLAFYDEFLGGEHFRVYMSDHGKGSCQKFHVLFNIYQEKLHPRKIRSMFSLLDFHKVLEQIVAEGCITEEKLTREYVEIGNLDRYAKSEAENILRRRRVLEERDFGCKGIIDKEYVYLRNTLGKEQLFRRDDMPLCDPLLFYDCNVYEPQLLEKYRELSGEYPKNMHTAEKFKYSGYLYRLYDNLKKRSGHVEKCVEIINKMLEKYEENSVAVRVGGYHSLVLYHILSKENKRKIWGFIDRSDKCQCEKLGLPVIGPERVERLKDAGGIKAILLSSYDIVKILRQEAKAYPAGMDILDIYDTFEKNGIRCDTNFYNVLGRDEDYKVGFPFEEE